jgi:nucleoid DNA-binding protein
MQLSTAIYRRAKRDGRNPSTGAKTLEELKKEAADKKKKLKSTTPGD